MCSKAKDLGYGFYPHHSHIVFSFDAVRGDAPMPARIKRILHIARKCLRQGGALTRGVNAGARRASSVAGHELSCALPRGGGGGAAASSNRRASGLASLLATPTPTRLPKAERIMRRTLPR
jgi:hypothetical protein